MGRLTKIYFPRLYKFVNLKDFLNRHLSLLQNTFGAMIILIMVMTKITRIIIIIIIIIIIMKIVIIIKTIKFTNMIGYHKTQFRLQWDSPITTIRHNNNDNNNTLFISHSEITEGRSLN